MYKREPDPWNFGSSAYELGRYDAIISALGHHRFRRAFEPGCSIGILTAKLSQLCGELVAIDVSTTAIERARLHCLSLPNVEVRVGRLPRDLPAGCFDLIVLSEIGYYFEDKDLSALGLLLASRLEHGGILLAAHWLGQSNDHVLGGERVHRILSRVAGLKPSHAEHHEGFQLNKWVRV